MMSGSCLRVFLLCISWIVADGTSTTEVIGHTGGSVHIRCEYSKRYSNYIKYFCKGVPPGCVDTIRTDAVQKLVTEGRYLLIDNGRGSFEVNISRLDSEDEGLYQCAVDIPRAVDIYEEVYVEVTDEEDTKGHQRLTETASPTLQPTRSTQEGIVSAVQPTRHAYTTSYPRVIIPIVVALIVPLVAVVILGITLCAKRSKSSGLVNLPSAMETESHVS